MPTHIVGAFLKQMYLYLWCSIKYKWYVVGLNETDNINEKEFGKKYYHHGDHLHINMQWLADNSVVT